MFLQKAGTMLLWQVISYISGEWGSPEERKSLKLVGEEKLQDGYTRMSRKQLSHEKQSRDSNCKDLCYQKTQDPWGKPVMSMWQSCQGFSRHFWRMGEGRHWDRALGFFTLKKNETEVPRRGRECSAKIQHCLGHWISFKSWKENEIPQNSWQGMPWQEGQFL